jgi:methyltransferase
MVITMPPLDGAVGLAWLLVALVSVERVVELVLSSRHAGAMLARGGVERGRGHYPAMVALHTGLLAGCALEPWLVSRGLDLRVAVPALALAGLAQGLRWWAIATLGPRWSTRVVFMPGEARVTSGPYRVIPHPNYLAVVVEGIALPLACSAWLTAAVFTVANAALLFVRIRAEEAALDEAEKADAAPSRRVSRVTGAVEVAS